MVETLTPAYGAAGDPVRVAGLNLDAPSLSADFGGVVTRPVTQTAAEAVFLVPPGAASGALTLRTTGGASAPVAFEVATPDSAPWADVSAGSFHTCGVKRDGRLLCWGENEAGQLGYGLELPGAYPRPVAGAGAWSSVIGGSYLERGNTCALDAAGSLWCWGDNNAGQFGNGSLASVTLPTISGRALGPWTNVAMGTYHTCAIQGTALFCWGTQKLYVMGDGRTSPYPETVTPPAGETGWSTVAAGTLHTCAVALPSRRLYCWGSNRAGQLGTGSFTDSTTPQPVAGHAAWQSVAAGSYVNEGNTCAIDTAGDLWCWGDSNHGQVGDGGADDRPAPVRVSARGPWRSVVLGGVHACALDARGAIWCWGNNATGQTGAADTKTVARVPARVGGDAGWASLTAGAGHTCALKTGGALYCWGNNDAGELGRRTPASFDPRPAPVAAAFR